MRFAVISDVHANLEALKSVLAEIERKSINEVYFIGDAVGYGPDPNECIEILKNECKVLLAGNHDWAVLGMTDVSYFNDYARLAIEWTKDILTENNKDILRQLPLVHEDTEKDSFFVHSTPLRPQEWNYLLTLRDAEIAFYSVNNKICFLGHSHQPFIIEKTPAGELLTYKNSTVIKKASRYIINAGSVGQPRDGNPEACCIFVEEDRINIVRIPYDIERVQEKMRMNNLPIHLIERLATGR